MSGLDRRLTRLERETRTEEPLSVRVRRRIIRQTPDGPLTLAVREDRIEGGKRTTGPWLTLDGEPADL